MKLGTDTLCRWPLLRSNALQVGAICECLLLDVSEQRCGKRALNQGFGELERSIKRTPIAVFSCARATSRAFLARITSCCRAAMRTFAVSRSDSTVSPLSNLAWLRSMIELEVLADCSATSSSWLPAERRSRTDHPEDNLLIRAVQLVSDGSFICFA